MASQVHHGPIASEPTFRGAMSPPSHRDTWIDECNVRDLSFLTMEEINHLEEVESVVTDSAMTIHM